ncbi:class I SAM-dependent methyltransferase [Mesorhizobium sp. M2E.F.Ca.ET.209.01.1.1]|uniref:class I SAM-dependent methyltransferase n=1 Tax=Mesorhizobium sp. M2E.F.Ca.ET.209.01.1.1 TaxID=2500526 RepID=UPI000FDCD053|nr:class I SAM-dependent methyltransferase [Mesorhizobium sp. M2E.F.Ca.ET.209.01.1.1]TGS19232.1 class I SAM-dependent methyltransferase [Mesorhizobium sp. M2E.F.Ca.ET.209.01.1.1]
MADGLSVDNALARLAVHIDNMTSAAQLADIALKMRPSHVPRQYWLEEIATTLRDNADTFDAVRRAAACVSHDLPDGEPAAMTVERLAGGFDRAAAISPAASVQLSSLGDEDRLSATTGEIALWLERQGMLGAHKRMLDIGCGIGRLEHALGAMAGSIVGIDISPGMIAIARRRCAGVANVEFRLTSGLDLDDFADQSFDDVLALDSFPYLMLAGVAGRHLGEIARVLRPGGMAAILNYSYRTSPDIDSRDINGLARAYGMHVLVDGEMPFRSWDGTVFLIRRGGGT